MLRPSGTGGERHGVWQSGAMTGGNRTAYRTCPLCEATCGLELTVAPDGTIVRIRGDRDDVFSRGFICPKGSSLKDLHEDPDRLRRPLVRRDGEFVEVPWDEAWKAVDEGLARVFAEHGRDAIGAYVGNPNAHNLGAMAYNAVWLRALGSRNRFSASTVDQIPKHVAGGYMFGSPVAIPVPDLDRTDFLLMLGANPLESNGSLCTAPDFPGRMERIRARGGRIVVVDPRRTRSVEAADEWVAIRPGTDGLLLAAMVHVLFDEGLVSIPERLTGRINGVEELRAAVAGITPDSVSAATGIPAADIARLARDLAAAPSAAVYGRIGVNAVRFGTVNAWLIDALNVLTGNIDRPGGAMFTRPATGNPTTRGEGGRGKGFRIGRGRSRVSARPEAMGEYPAAVMAEEILEPGEGRIRAMVTAAGNPVLSTPHAGQLERALESLDFMVSIDIYLNETTRHADVILPPPSALERDHYDLSLYAFAVRNVANYSPAVLPRDPSSPDEWEILAKLAGILQGLGPGVDPCVVDDQVIAGMVHTETASTASPLAGREPAEILDALAASGRRGPARMLDLMLQAGPYGAAFGANPGGLSLDVLLDNPHGVDLGPLEPRLPSLLRTPTGMVELAPVEFLADLVELARTRDVDSSPMLLVGRRDLKSNNSWMHNLRILTKGRLACSLHVHPDDARRLSLVDGGRARVTSRVGEVVADVQVTDAVRTGVVSLPHGWGHSSPGVRLAVARTKAGVNANILTDDAVLDPLSGNAALNAVPVTVSAVSGQ